MRTWLLVLVLILGSAFVWSRRRVEDLERANARLEAAEKDVDARIKKMNDELSRLRSRDTSNEAAATSRREALKEKIAAKTAEISSLDSTIARRKNAGIDTAANANLLAQIADAKKGVAAIDRELAEARAQAAAVRSVDEETRKRDRNAWNVDRETRRSAIESLAKEIADRVAREKELRARKFDADAKAEANAIAKTVAEDRVRIATLKQALKDDERGRKERKDLAGDAAVRAKAITDRSVAELQARRRAAAAKLEILNRALSGVAKSEGEERDDLSDLERERAERARELEALKGEWASEAPSPSPTPSP